MLEKQSEHQITAKDRTNAGKLSSLLVDLEFVSNRKCAAQNNKEISYVLIEYPIILQDMYTNTSTIQLNEPELLSRALKS